jgi:hypothetical protein
MIHNLFIYINCHTITVMSKVKCHELSYDIHEIIILKLIEYDDKINFVKSNLMSQIHMIMVL